MPIHSFHQPSARVRRLPAVRCLTALAVAGTLAAVQAAELVPSDDQDADSFGSATSQAGSLTLIGSPEFGSPRNGQAYLYRFQEPAGGIITENARLTTSTGTVNNLGDAVSLSGTSALVGAGNADGANPRQGAAYFYRNLDTATGTIAENVKLIASDGVKFDAFGDAVGLSDGIGLVGAYFAAVGTNPDQGAAYVYRNLQTASGIITQSAKLLASDGGYDDGFGLQVAMAGKIGLVGSSGADVEYPTGTHYSQGAVYVFHHLDTAAGTVTEDARLIASGQADTQIYGYGLFSYTGVSLSGTTALVGATYIGLSGAAYLYRNVDTATGTVTENARLATTEAFVNLGSALSLSGSNALVTSATGVYLYQNLDTAVGDVFQQVRILPTAPIGFGSSLSLDGDRFVIGAYDAIAYTGNVSSLTTLDVGHTSQVVTRISFISSKDWIIGQTTDANSILLGHGDGAEVRGPGKAVYIGQNAGADDNLLVLQGKVDTSIIQVGSLAGNRNNTLRLEDTAGLLVTFIRLAPRNRLVIQGNYLDPNALAAYLRATKLQVFQGGQWQTFNAGNFHTLLVARYSGGYTTLQPKP